MVGVGGPEPLPGRLPGPFVRLNDGLRESLTTRRQEGAPVRRVPREPAGRRQPAAARPSGHRPRARLRRRRREGRLARQWPSPRGHERGTSLAGRPTCGLGETMGEASPRVCVAGHDLCLMRLSPSERRRNKGQKTVVTRVERREAKSGPMRVICHFTSLGQTTKQVHSGARGRRFESCRARWPASRPGRDRARKAGLGWPGRA
jgi:hypothetical protein